MYSACEEATTVSADDMAYTSSEAQKEEKRNEQFTSGRRPFLGSVSDESSPNPAVQLPWVTLHNS